jgi:hypothetical protein
LPILLVLRSDCRACIMHGSHLVYCLSGRHAPPGSGKPTNQAQPALQKHQALCAPDLQLSNNAAQHRLQRSQALGAVYLQAVCSLFKLAAAAAPAAARGALITLPLASATSCLELSGMAPPGSTVYSIPTCA